MTQIIAISIIVFHVAVTYFAIGILKYHKAQSEINANLDKRLRMLENELYNETHEFNEYL
jgi:hypothetical protein